MTDSTTTVTGNLKYRRTGYDQAVRDKPDIPINPVAAMVAEFIADYERRHGSDQQYQQLDAKAQKERVFDWVRNDPEKMQPVITAFAEFRKRVNGWTHMVTTEFSDGRALEGAGLDTTGFTLLPHRTNVVDWNDENEVQQTYYPDITQYVQKLTGADLAFCNDHSIRQTEDIDKKDDKIATEDPQMDPLGLSMKNPLPVVHNDFTPTYAESLARALELDDPSEARMATFGLLGHLKAAGVTGEDLRTKYDVKVVNAWRNCSEHPLETMPLAMCDRRTVGHQGELVDHVLNIKGGVLPTVTSMHSDSDKHKWYWYPDMTNEEVLLFKTYDSAESSSRGQLHSAFQPHGSKPVRGRFSCEARVLCLFSRG